MLELLSQLVEEGHEPSSEVLTARLQGPADQIGRGVAAWQRYHELVRHCSQVPTTPRLKPGTKLGDFVLEDVLGWGGSSVVYRARQRSLCDRPVAVKVLDARDSAGASALERFRREGRLAAQVAHPHLAQVLGVGEENGVLFHAMRLVEGETLQRVLTRVHERTASQPDFVRSRDYVLTCARIASEVASALVVVHRHGLLHRDVKPSNVILEGTRGPLDEVLHHPAVLIDFGLVRPTGPSDVTTQGNTPGTAAYAAPEARLGVELDARADVFSLGATLHDLLTATSCTERPIAAAGLRDVRAVNRAVPMDLAAIVAMSTKANRDGRYEDGRALFADLEHFLQQRPIRARRHALLHTLKLWIERDPVRAAKKVLAAAISSAALVALFVLVTAAIDACRAGRRALADERAGNLAEARAGYARFEASAVPTFLLPGFEDVRRRARLHSATSDRSRSFAAVVDQLVRPSRDDRDTFLFEIARDHDERLDFDACVLPRITRLVKSGADDDPALRSAVVGQLALVLYLRSSLPRETMEDATTRQQLWDDKDGLAVALLELVAPDSDGSRDEECLDALTALGGLPCADLLEPLWRVRATPTRSEEERSLAAAGVARILSRYRAALPSKPLPECLQLRAASLLAWSRQLVLESVAAADRRLDLSTTANDPPALRELLLTLRQLGRPPSLAQLGIDCGEAFESRLADRLVSDLGACGTEESTTLLRHRIAALRGRSDSGGRTECAFGAGLVGGSDGTLVEESLSAASSTDARFPSTLLDEFFTNGTKCRLATWNSYELQVDPRSHVAPSGTPPTKFDLQLFGTPSAVTSRLAPFPPRGSGLTLRGTVFLDFTSPSAPCQGGPVHLFGEEISWERDDGTKVPTGKDELDRWLRTHPDHGISLNFVRPTSSWARFDFDVPSGSAEARVTLEHLHTSRAGLPHQGQATVNLETGVLQRVEAPSTTPRLVELPIPPQDVRGKQHLLLTLRLGRASSLYRVTRMQVDFY